MTSPQSRFGPVANRWGKQSYVGGLYLDRGIEVVRSWLRPLLLPYVRESYSMFREEYGLPPSDGDSPAKTATPLAQRSTNTPSEASRSMWASPSAAQYSVANVGHLALFNQCLQQVSKSVEWVYADSAGEGTKTTPVWVSEDLYSDFVTQVDNLLSGRESHCRWKLHWSWTREHKESCEERSCKRRTA